MAWWRSSVRFRSGPPVPGSIDQTAIGERRSWPRDVHPRSCPHGGHVFRSGEPRRRPANATADRAVAMAGRCRGPSGAALGIDGHRFPSRFNAVPLGRGVGTSVRHALGECASGSTGGVPPVLERHRSRPGRESEARDRIPRRNRYVLPTTLRRRWAGEPGLRHWMGRGCGPSTRASWSTTSSDGRSRRSPSKRRSRGP